MHASKSSGVSVTSGRSLVSATSTTTSSSSPQQPPLLLTRNVMSEIQSLVAQNDTTSTIQVQGVISARRRLGKSMAFLDMVVNTTPSSNEQAEDAESSTVEVVQVLLKRETYRDRTTVMITNLYNCSQHDHMFWDDFADVLTCLLQGTEARLTGTAMATNNPGEAVLLVTGATVIHISDNPQRVRPLLHRIISVHDINTSSSTSLETTANCTTTSTTTPSISQLWNTELQQSSGLDAEQLIDWYHEEMKKDQDATEAQQKVSFLPDLDSSRQQSTMGLSTKQYERLRRKQNRKRERRRTSDNDVLYRLSQRVIAHQRNYQLESKMNLAQEGAAVKGEAQHILPSAPHALNHPNLNQLGIQDMAIIEGWVQNRRRYRGNITALVLTASNQTDADCLTCVLHPLTFEHHTVANDDEDGRGDMTGLYGTLLAPGTKVRLTGKRSSTTPTTSANEDVFSISRVELLQACGRPITLRFALEHLSVLELTEAANAFRISEQRTAELLDAPLMERQWMAAELSTKLTTYKNEQTNRQSSSSPTDESKSMFVLDRYAELRKTFPILESNNTAAHRGAFPRIEFDADISMHVMLGKGSRWERQKLPQLQWMWRKITEVCKWSSLQQQSLQVLDIGGGRGLLANHLASQLQGSSAKDSLFRDDVLIQVADIAKGAIANGRIKSERQGFGNMIQYHPVDASRNSFGNKTNLVVALHACGGLTDVALQQAFRTSAMFVICPCCYLSNRHLRLRAWEDDQSSADGMSIHEWLGIDPTDLDVLRRLAEMQGDYILALEAAHTICALRAAAMVRDDYCNPNEVDAGRIQIEAFPVQYSKRNLVLVGYPSKTTAATELAR